MIKRGASIQLTAYRPAANMLHSGKMAFTHEYVREARDKIGIATEAFFFALSYTPTSAVQREVPQKYYSSQLYMQEDNLGEG